jgi:hypothetical protein
MVVDEISYHDEWPWRTESWLRNLFFELREIVLYETSVRNPFFWVVQNSLVRNLIRAKPKKGLEFVAILETLFRFRIRLFFFSVWSWKILLVGGKLVVYLRYDKDIDMLCLDDGWAVFCVGDMFWRVLWWLLILMRMDDGWPVAVHLRNIVWMVVWVIFLILFMSEWAWGGQDVVVTCFGWVFVNWCNVSGDSSILPVLSTVFATTACSKLDQRSRR